VIGHNFFLNDFKEISGQRKICHRRDILPKIDIVNLSECLNLSQEEGEKWIFNLDKRKWVQMPKLILARFVFQQVSSIAIQAPSHGAFSECHRDQPALAFYLYYFPDSALDPGINIVR